MTEDGRQEPRDIYLGRRLDEGFAQVAERLESLGERISESTGRLHERLDQQARDLPGGIRKAVEQAVAPLVPVPARWWERSPWNMIVVLAAMWLFVVASGAAVSIGLLPDGMLERLVQTAVDYVETGGPGVMGSVGASP